MSVAWQEDIIKLAKCQMNAKEFSAKYKEITIEEAKIMKILMEKSAKSSYEILRKSSPRPPPADISELGPEPSTQLSHTTVLDAIEKGTQR